MSVVGVDLGNVNAVIAVARNRGVDIICNEVSNRMTPSLVSFGPKSRYLGESAKTQEVSNFRNTVASLKRILGCTLDQVSAIERRYLNCELCEKDGQVGVRVQYCGQETEFSATELMAMFLGKLKDITHAEVKNAAMDMVLSVPVYYTDLQRRALLDAAEIAQVRCVRLMNENTAAALAYAMPKFDLPEDTPRHVCFIDIGQSSYTVTVTAMKKGQLEIKGVGFDANFGGRDFDEVLVEHFCDEFLAKRKLDIRANKKALFRLRAACERVKKVLSANAVTSLHVENVMDEVDVSAEITRAAFEELCAPLLSRFQAPIVAALAMAKVGAHEIDAVELVGGSTRVSAIKEQLMRIFGKELSTTLNQDEAVARGCALQCALQSPVFKVREFATQDITAHGVKFVWDPLPEAPEDIEYEVFPQGHHQPSTKLLSFKRPLPFTVHAVYSATGVTIGSYAIQATGEGVDLASTTIKVKSRVNPSGIFGVEGASVVNDADATQKTGLSVVSSNGSLSKKMLETKAEAEASMASSDKLVADTADSKNALEEYIYEMRAKIEGAFDRFASDKEKGALVEKLSAAENWLYGEGEEASKSVYIARLQDLKSIGGPIAERAREHESVPHAESVLRQTIQEYAALAQSTDEQYSHIEVNERAKVLAECNAKQQWLEERLKRQASRPLYEPLVVTSSQIIDEKNKLISTCFPIMNKAKPKKPATTDAPAKEGTPAADASSAPAEELLLTDEEPEDMQE